MSRLGRSSSLRSLRRDGIREGIPVSRRASRLEPETPLAGRHPVTGPGSERHVCGLFSKIDEALSPTQVA